MIAKIGQILENLKWKAHFQSQNIAKVKKNFIMGKILQGKFWIWKENKSRKSKIFQENFSGCNIYLKMTDNVEKWGIMVKIGKTWRKWENNTNEWGYVFEILQICITLSYYNIISIIIKPLFFSTWNFFFHICWSSRYTLKRHFLLH